MNNQQVVEYLQRTHPDLVKMFVHHNYRTRRTEFLWVFTDGQVLPQELSWYGEPLGDFTFLNIVDDFLLSKGR